jgi:hypothetical protein
VSRFGRREGRGGEHWTKEISVERGEYERKLRGVRRGLMIDSWREKIGRWWLELGTERVWIRVIDGIAS